MITYKRNQRVEGKPFQNVFIIVTLEGVEYEVNASAPAAVNDSEIKKYIEAQDKWIISVARTVYQGMPKLDILDDVKKWIADSPKKEKAEWTNKHPVDLEAEIDAAKDLDALKTVMKKALIK